MFSKVSIVLALAASASAHITMKWPVPYSKDSLDNSPLAGAADFPCKQRPNMYQVSQMNAWNAGETKQVEFLGSAVHGGGSCQFSITTDSAPTKDSQWKVIQSNIGGCPANIGNTNLPNVVDPQASSGPSFPVTMPKDIPSGQYTFSWSWINKIGNREFYMNCAPIQVGGSSNTASVASASQAMSALPDMFVANLPNTKNDAANGCSTLETVDFVYPNPGQNVVKSWNATEDATTSGAGCKAQADMGRGKGQIGSPSAGTPAQSGTPSQPQVSAKPSASAPAAAPSPAKSSAAANPGYPGGVFAPGASSAPASKPTAQPAQPAQPSAPVAQPIPSAKPQPPKDAPNNTTPVNGDCTPCSNDGAVVCIGSKQFGLCNRGCAVAQDLAAGMACTNGAVVAATKRHLHFPRAHLHRRLSAARLL